MTLTDERIVAIAPDSDLSRSLQAAHVSGAPLIVDTGERRYRLVIALAEPEFDRIAPYDPRAAVAGLRALHEALAGVDREGLLEDLRAQREQDSSGRPA